MNTLFFFIWKEKSLIAIVIALIPLIFVSCMEKEYSSIGAGIAGRVTSADTGEPIAGASVIIEGRESQSIVTDSDGRFKLEDVSPGTYEITVSATGYELQHYTVTVSDGIASADISLKKIVPPALSGSVTNAATGEPIVNASVETIPATYVANTDETGQYSFQNLDAGTYKVTVTAVGFESKTIPVKIKAGRTTRADVQLVAIGASLKVRPTSLDFGKNSKSKLLTIENIGIGVLTWKISAPNEPWITVNPKQGSTAQTASTVTVNVKREGLKAGIYQTTLSVTSNGGSQQVDVLMEVE